MVDGASGQGTSANRWVQVLVSLEVEMNMRVTGLCCFCALAWLSTSAHAALFDRGNGLIYDSVQDLTWLQDANYARTSGHDSDGMMKWADAMAWADGLTYGGFDDWRLPTTIRFDDPSCLGDDRGASLFFEHHVGCTGGEMERLTLELYDPGELDKVLNGEEKVMYPFQDELFTNIKDFRYWTATPYRDPDGDGVAMDPCVAGGYCVANNDNGIRRDFYWQWSFIPNLAQPTLNGPYKTTLAGGNPRYAWAVRDGDVLSPVPVPAAAWLFGSGLLGLSGFLRRRRYADG